MLADRCKDSDKQKIKPEKFILKNHAITHNKLDKITRSHIIVSMNPHFH